MPSDYRYLDTHALRRLAGVSFASRRPVEGLYAGRHASQQRGHSVEFNDYRPYMPGDTPADVDWKIYGRTDRLYVKLFEHQTDLTLQLLIDGSASMAYQGDGTRSKFDHAARMAAAISFLATRQQDNVGLALARDGLAAHLPPARSQIHLHAMMEQLEDHRCAERAALDVALKDLAARVHRRSLLVIFSDLLDDAQAITRAMSIFTHRRSEVVIFHVLHRDEMHLPEVQEALFIDSEEGNRLALNVDDLRTSYEQRMHRFIEGWRSTCRARGVDYTLTTTADDPLTALRHYLFARAGSV